VDKTCKEFDVLNTRFAGYMKADDADGTEAKAARGWREIWSLKGCGKDFGVALAFLPDGGKGGTDISAVPVQ